MKTIYKFSVPNVKTVEKQVQKEIDGKPVTVVEKVEESTPVTFFIKRPTRNDQDEAGLFHDIQLGKDVRAGVLTHSEVIKRFVSEDAVIGQVYKDYATKENEYQRLVLDEKSAENTIKKDKLEQELLSLLRQMENFEISKEAFNSTAESRARNKTLLWWILNLSYTDKNELFFSGDSFEQKLESYDKIMESEKPEDRFSQDVTGRFLYFILFWYKRLLANRATTEADFKEADDQLNAQIARDKEEQNKLVPENKVDDKPILDSAPKLEEVKEDKKE